MHTQKTNVAGLSQAPQLESPLRPSAPKVKTEGGDLFASELERANGGDGAEARRESQQVQQRRRANQAQRIDQASEARAKGRSVRQQNAELQGARRDQRVEAEDDMSDTGFDARQLVNERPIRRQETSIENRPQKSDPERPARLDPRPEVPAEPESVNSQARDSQGLTLASRFVESGARADGSSRVSSPAVEATNRPARTQAIPEAQTNTNSESRSSDRVNQRKAGAEAKTRGAPSDALGELLLEREAELDRQASVLRQLKAQLGPTAREISLQLSPASLGEVQMRIALRSGRLTAILRASRPESLEALKNQIPELKASLEAQGLEVVEIDLGLTDERSLTLKG